jgi:gas vesicle protein
MKKVFSFMAGALCGVLVGGVTTLLLTPASGEDLRKQAEERWQLAMDEARQARDERQRELEAQFSSFTSRQTS